MTKPSTALALRKDGNDSNVRKVRPTRARIKQWHAAFLRSLAKTPSVTIAARSAGVSTRACYKARDADPAFAEAWSDAVNKSVDALEHEVYQRALKEDSQLAMFVLKAFRPERYRETSRVEIDQRLCGVIILPEKEQKEP
jgi:hypothetical protein